MSSKMNRSAYEQLIAENLAWLDAQPRTLEREHIRQIVAQLAEREYGDKKNLPSELACEEIARVRREVLKEAAEVCRRGTWTGKEGTAWRLDCAEEIEELADELPKKAEEKK